jgi:hypothetical protein
LFASGPASREDNRTPFLRLFDDSTVLGLAGRPPQWRDIDQLAILEPLRFPWLDRRRRAKLDPILHPMRGHLLEQRAAGCEQNADSQLPDPGPRSRSAHVTIGSIHIVRATVHDLIQAR